jgi:membrane protein implicated in regulation of membrane protease activity
MNQEKIESFIEAIANNGSGFIVSVILLTYGILPLYEAGILVNPIVMTLIFTAISIIRSYLWRRFFNAGLHKFIHNFLRRIYNGN